MSKDSIFPDGLFGSDEGEGEGSFFKRPSPPKKSSGAFFDLDSTFLSIFEDASSQNGGFSHTKIRASETGSHKHVDFDDSVAKVDPDGTINIKMHKGSLDVTSHSRSLHLTQWKFTFPGKGTTTSLKRPDDDDPDIIDIDAEDIK